MQYFQLANSRLHYHIDLGAEGYGRVETHWNLHPRGGGTVQGFLQMRDDQPARD
jgi:hypothetical protein